MCKKDGQHTGKTFLARLDALEGALSLEDVRYTPGRFHELTGNRRGQWACDLDHPYRLIFKPGEDSVTHDQNGFSFWSEIRTIEIIEITDYH